MGFYVFVNSFIFLVFFSFARPAKKQKAEARAHSSPDPSCARASPNFKNISRIFANPFPQKICFAKIRPLYLFWK